MRWGQEEDGRASDLEISLFGVSPTDMGGPGLTTNAFYGRGAQIVSSPRGGVGEFSTPPRFHYIQAGTAQQQRTSHSASYNPFPPTHSHHHNYTRRERQSEGDMNNLTQRFASSSIDDSNDSIDADSTTDADSATDDGPAVND